MSAQASAPERITRTVPQCAAELGVSPDTLVRWIEQGHLAAFVPPGKAIGDAQPGPKGYLVFLDDWRAFLRARTMTGAPAPPASPSATSRARAASGPATGTDGVRRRRPRH